MWKISYLYQKQHRVGTMSLYYYELLLIYCCNDTRPRGITTLQLLMMNKTRGKWLMYTISDHEMYHVIMVTAGLE